MRASLERNAFTKELSFPPLFLYASSVSSAVERLLNRKDGGDAEEMLALAVSFTRRA